MTEGISHRIRVITGEAKRQLKEPFAITFASGIFKFVALYFKTANARPVFVELAEATHYWLTLLAVSWIAAVLWWFVLDRHLSNRVYVCLTACCEELLILGGIVVLTRATKYYLHVINAPDWSMEIIQFAHVGTVVVVTFLGVLILIRHMVGEIGRSHVRVLFERMGNWRR